MYYVYLFPSDRFFFLSYRFLFHPYHFLFPSDRFLFFLIYLFPHHFHVLITFSLSLGHFFSLVFVTTVKPRFTGPLGGKELGPVNREARYIGVQFTLIYTQSLFLGDGIEAR